MAQTTYIILPMTESYHGVSNPTEQNGDDINRGAMQTDGRGIKCLMSLVEAWKGFRAG